MRVVSLEIENVKGIRAVDLWLDPGQSVVEIHGENGAGKSSVMDSLWLICTGKSAKTATGGTPLRIGEDEGHATVVLEREHGDLIATRRWKRHDPSGEVRESISVKGADGTTYPRPAELLASFVGPYAFDPFAFAQASARDQVRMLVDVVALPFDPDELEAERAALFGRRTDRARVLREAKAQLDGMEKPPRNTPDAEVSMADLTSEYQASIDARALRNTLKDSVVYWQDEVTRAEEAVDVARSRLVEQRNKFQVADAADASRPSAETIRERMESVEDTNRAVRAKAAREAHALRVGALMDQVEDFTNQLTAIEQKRAQGLAGVTMPIEGLSFDQDGLTFQGRPFATCSRGERLTVSTAIAMSPDPELKVCAVADASLLDDEHREIIRSMARDRGYLVFLEIVGAATGSEGITIVDGTVA